MELSFFELIGLIATVVALMLSWRANKISSEAKKASEKSNEIQIEIAKRNGVIELHHAWSGINSIHTFQPNAEDVKNALNALSLTSSLINHDVMNVNIIYDQYWLSFKELYNTLKKMDSNHIFLNYVPSERLTKDIQMAYKTLEKIEISESKQYGR